MEGTIYSDEDLHRLIEHARTQSVTHLRLREAGEHLVGLCEELLAGRAERAEIVATLARARDEAIRDACQWEALARRAGREAYGACKCCRRCGPTIPCREWIDAEGQRCEGLCACGTDAG